jgi:hypothetical protein
MMVSVLEKQPRVNQINWKLLGAAIFSALTLLAALPYSLGDLATVIPPAWKPTMFLVSFSAALILRAWNAIKPKQ